jgi:hypothetical protein
MALYFGEGQEIKSNYFVLVYGIILWNGAGEFIKISVLRCGIILRGGTGESIKILYIEIWQYTGWTGESTKYCVL